MSALADHWQREQFLRAVLSWYAGRPLVTWWCVNAWLLDVELSAAPRAVFRAWYHEDCETVPF